MDGVNLFRTDVEFGKCFMTEQTPQTTSLSDYFSYTSCEGNCNIFIIEVQCIQGYEAASYVIRSPTFRDNIGVSSSIVTSPYDH
jgi:hypothetical protein